MIRFETEKWFGLDCLYMRVNNYEAKIVPALGGKLIMLKDLKEDINLIRIPPHKWVFQSRMRALCYGGSIGLEVKENQGLFPSSSARKWVVTSQEIVNNQVIKIELTNYQRENTSKITYLLDETGLTQQMQVKNEGSGMVAVGVVNHATFNLFFHPQCEKKELRLKLDKKDIDNLRIHKKIELREEVNSLAGIIDKEYSNITNQDFLIEDIKIRKRIRYEVDKAFSSWRVFNNKGRGDFLCVAPNTKKIYQEQKSSDSGYLNLKSEESFCVTSKWSCEVF